MKKAFFILTLLAVSTVCFAQPATVPLPTGNSSETRDILSGKNFMCRSVGLLIRETWYVTFNYDGTYMVTAAGIKIVSGQYSVSGTTVNLLPLDFELLEYADIFGLWEGTLDSAENPAQLKWNFVVYKLATDRQ
jgi:hypothetical protein